VTVMVAGTSPERLQRWVCLGVRFLFGRERGPPVHLRTDHRCRDLWGGSDDQAIERLTSRRGLCAVHGTVGAPGANTDDGMRVGARRRRHSFLRADFISWYCDSSYLPLSVGHIRSSPAGAGRDSNGGGQWHSPRK